MAVSVSSILKERKYPFLFSLFVLLILVLFFLLTTSQSPINFTSDSIVLQSKVISPPAPISNPTTDPPQSPLNDSIDLTQSPSKNNPIDLDFDFDWKVCVGYVATDHIPCLDNLRAIKALKSRRHMEHRERHCPNASPRCLVPLPQGYKVPVPWPKSRDMVRLIILW